MCQDYRGKNVSFFWDGIIAKNDKCLNYILLPQKLIYFHLNIFLDLSYCYHKIAVILWKSKLFFTIEYNYFSLHNWTKFIQRFFFSKRFLFTQKLFIFSKVDYFLKSYFFYQNLYILSKVVYFIKICLFSQKLFFFSQK